MGNSLISTKSVRTGYQLCESADGITGRCWECGPSLSVQAQDPDGNALTYIWSVNGQIVSDASGPAYSFQLPAGVNGPYTVTVMVTDGSRVTETSWNINAAPYRPVRVLFDESHQDILTLTTERAQQLYPNNPAFGSAAILGQALAQNYQVTSMTSGSFTSQALEEQRMLQALPGKPRSISTSRIKSRKASH